MGIEHERFEDALPDYEQPRRVWILNSQQFNLDMHGRCQRQCKDDDANFPYSDINDDLLPGSVSEQRWKPELHSPSRPRDPACVREASMDLTPYIGAIVTVIISFGLFYGAVNARLARLEARIEDNQKITQAELVNLRRDVEKHNNVIERTYKLETEVDNLYHRYDELRTDVKDVKIGGTE